MLPEIILLIMGNLDTKSVLYLMNSSKKLYKTGKKESRWKKMRIKRKLPEPKFGETDYDVVQRFMAIACKLCYMYKGDDNICKKCKLKNDQYNVLTAAQSSYDITQKLLREKEYRLMRASIAMQHAYAEALQKI